MYSKNSAYFVIAMCTLTLVGACTSSERDPAKTDAATDSLNTQEDIVASTTETSAWQLSERGLGPVHVGMDVTQARTALGGNLTVEPEGESCQYGQSNTTPDGVYIMIVDDTVARIDIQSGQIPTTAGVRIGDTEGDVRKAYPDRVTTEPHKYTDGQYVIVMPGAPADTMYRVIFETDTLGNVLRFRGGKMPMVRWVEGCS